MNLDTTIVTTSQKQRNHFFGAHNHDKENKFFLGNFVLWFPKKQTSRLGKFKKRWFNFYKVQYCLLMTIDKFDPNFILVNIKPY
jgi:hypothetical protein